LLHADKKHSGHRFWEELYSEVKSYEKDLAEIETAKRLQEELKKDESVELEADERYCNI